MPQYDFQCARHGVFEAMSTFSGTGVESVPCTRCGELAPVVWLRSPAMRKPGYEAIRFAGNDIPVESIEKALAEPAPDDDAGFWDDPNFGGEFIDALDRNTGRWHAQELPPVTLTDQEMKTLQEGVGAKG